MGDTSPGVSCASAKKNGRKIVAAVAALSLIILSVRLMFTAIYFDNLIDDDLSADSKNLATDFAYLWKWNILTSAAVYGLSLSAFGLNVITAGFAMRSAGRRDNTFDNGARTVDLDSNHTIHHALSVVSAVVTAGLAFCVVYLRGG